MAAPPVLISRAFWRLARASSSVVPRGIRARQFLDEADVYFGNFAEHGCLLQVQVDPTIRIPPSGRSARLVVAPFLTFRPVV